MAVISRAIPTLLRGISQSSDALKQADHADIQDNADSNPVLGLTKRSGSKFLASISNSTLGNVHIQTINRDANEQYVALLESIMQEWEKLSGVNRQRQGMVGNYEGKATSQQAIVQSSHITEEWFYQHNSLKGNVLEALTDTAKVAWGDGKKKKIQ